jgi:hypothetical protein
MNTAPRQQLIVWWLLWAAFQTGIFMFARFLGSNHAQEGLSSPDSPAWLAGFVPLCISMTIRWLVLPQVRTAQAGLPLFLVGIAVAEITCFLGLFIFPEHQKELVALSAIGVFQFVPFFARRYFEPKDERLNS